MNTRLTVSDVRSILYRIVNPADANDPLFLIYLNQACERLINSGKWAGTLVTVLFDSSDGYITLPREYLAILGAQVDDAPVVTYTQFHEYIETGGGQIDETQGFDGVLTDMGDGYCVQTDISADCTLRIKINSASDVGQVVRLFGKDENGEMIYDSDGIEGVELTLASPSATTTQQFSVITGIQADALVGRWTLWEVISGAETQIGSYQPGETRPMYRRYKTGVTTTAVRALCRRRFVPLTEESNWVIPGNIGALRQAIDAIHKEEVDADSDADAMWARAYRLLNEELKALGGGNRAQIAMDYWGTGNGLPYGN